MNVRQLATRVEQGQQAASAQQERRKLVIPLRGAGTSFKLHLELARQAAGQGIPTKISNHAWQRMEQRGIQMTEADHRTLGEAMQQLEAKGARDALLMRADAAFVVNVPNRTVVTALDRHEMQHRIFTQIDSAMLLGVEQPVPGSIRD